MVVQRKWLIMKNRPLGEPSSIGGSGSRFRLPWLLAAGCLLVILLALLLPRRDEDLAAGAAATDQPAAAADGAATTTHERPFVRRTASQSSVGLALTAEEIVTNKVAQFARSRRKLAHALAGHFKTPVPEEFERFFDAAEAGRYEEMTAIYKALGEQRKNGPAAWHGPQWQTIIETQGAADAAHDWPAQKLLDYGNSVLGALRPGIVYMGGTDPGRFIPALLNETSEGERHVVLTQNALTDVTYLDYLSFFYGDRMKTPTRDDNERAFQGYLADAQKRFEHDQQFPGEPKQVRPGEDLRFTDGRFQASGQISVVAVREKLFQLFMQNNPGVAFALEESFPLKSTYATATPLGPIMELGAAERPNALTAQRAAQSVDYWRGVARQLEAEPDDSEPRKTYSKMISAQAGLFLARGYAAEADQRFGLPTKSAPPIRKPSIATSACSWTRSVLPRRWPLDKRPRTLRRTTRNSARFWASSRR